MKTMLLIAALLSVAALAAVAVWVRVAPSDPALWHVPVADATPAVAGPCAEKVVEVPQGARATCLLPSDPAAVLTGLNSIALAAPRTTLLAGTPAEGRITWISRSRLMGFPDYVTAEAVQTPQGTRLDVLSRQRFGQKDLGVNAARLKGWLAAL